MIKYVSLMVVSDDIFTEIAAAEMIFLIIYVHCGILRFMFKYAPKNLNICVIG